MGLTKTGKLIEDVVALKAADVYFTGWRWVKTWHQLILLEECMLRQNGRQLTNADAVDGRTLSSTLGAYVGSLSINRVC